MDCLECYCDIEIGKKISVREVVLTEDDIFETKIIYAESDDNITLHLVGSVGIEVYMCVVHTVRNLKKIY